MSDTAHPEKSFEERKREITEINKLLESWLADINQLYRQTYHNINLLKTKIDDKESLKLLPHFGHLNPNHY